MVALSGHAYPWDVLGDPDFPLRVRELGLRSVTLAASYHSARAATPLHPRHQLVDASHSALYRPVRETAWAGRRLRPAGPEWMDEVDPFGTAAGTLQQAGIDVTAWVVLTHSTRLGTEFPDVAVTNCFGDRYAYALCPNRAEVRDYAAALAAEAVRGVSLSGVSLEACGQLGLAHLGHHEKTDGAWRPEAIRWLSVCCCAACTEEWTERGLDEHEVRAQLRAAVRDEGGAPDGKVADTLLAVRHAATAVLRAQVLAAVRKHAPGVPVTLHAQPDPWATGPSPGLTATAASDVDILLVPAWPTTAESAETVARTAQLGTPVHAYLTVLPPAEADAAVAHAQRLVAAGASGLGLYHLGLAPPWRQRALAEIVAAVT